jgi:hypothetical protein
MTVDTPAPEESSLQPKAESPQNQTSGKLEIPEDLMAPAALMEESTHSPQQDNGPSSPREEEPLEEVSRQSIFKHSVSTQEFMKSYFTKGLSDLPCFRETDLKQRMILVRKAVALLEREHFQPKSAR